MARFGLILFLAVVIPCISAIPPKKYMDSRCGETLTIGSTVPSIRFDLTWSSKYRNNMNCVVTVRAANISATSDTRIMLVFRKLDIKGSDFFGCSTSGDLLYIHDGPSTSDPAVRGLAKTFCGEREPRGAYMSRGDSLTFRFKSDFYKTDDGFKLLLTPFHKGSCTSSEYRCNAGQCISSQNKCDSYRQCGESLDECEVTRTTSWVAGVVIGIIALLAVIGVAVFCIRRHFMNRQSSGGAVKYTAPPQQVTSAPTYQQPGVNPPYQQPATAPGYYPQGPAPPPQGYPPQNAAYPPPVQNTPYPPPYPDQQQPGYPPATNPYPYGAPAAQ